MKFVKSGSTVWVSSAVIFLALTASAPAEAAVRDAKQIDAATCQPYGPNTTASELVYNQLGVTNPGVTNESVLCPLTSDSETTWSASPGVSAYMYVYYRAGAIAGKAACTVFAGKVTTNSGTTYSVTDNPAVNTAANTRSSLEMPLADSIGSIWAIAPPLVALCTLTPKVSLGSFALLEYAVTNTP